MSSAHNNISNGVVRIALTIFPSGTVIEWSCGPDSGMVTGSHLSDTLQNFVEVIKIRLFSYETIEIVYDFP